MDWRSEESCRALIPLGTFEDHWVKNWLLGGGRITVAMQSALFSDETA